MVSVFWGTYGAGAAGVRIDSYQKLIGVVPLFGSVIDPPEQQLRQPSTPIWDQHRGQLLAPSGCRLFSVSAVFFVCVGDRLLLLHGRKLFILGRRL